MKVTGVKNHFKPVNITIESDTEARALRQALHFWYDNYDESDYTCEEIILLKELRDHVENIAIGKFVHE